MLGKRNIQSNTTTNSNNDLRPIVSYHVHNQTGFDNPAINGRGLIYVRVSKMSFIF